MASMGIRPFAKVNSNGGIKICCCRVCTCVNFGILTSKIGLLKIAEVTLATLCESLLIRYGLPYASNIGQALISFLTTTACCFTTCTILLICYCFSERSFNQIRQSLFEVLFNAVACAMYMSASSYMGFTSVMWLYPQFLITPGFWAYPAMSAVYWMGYVAAIFHGLDCYIAYKQFRGYR